MGLLFTNVHEITRFMIVNEPLCESDYVCFGHCLRFCVLHSESKRLQCLFVTLVSIIFLETSPWFSIFFFADYFKSMFLQWCQFDKVQINKLSLFMKNLVVRIQELVYRGSASIEVMVPYICIIVEYIILTLVRSQSDRRSLGLYLLNILPIKVGYFHHMNQENTDEILKFLKPYIQIILLKQKDNYKKFCHKRRTIKKIALIFLTVIKT